MDSMQTQRAVVMVSGVLAIAAAVVVGSSLAAEAWTPGSLGFPLFLALPGLGLIAYALRRLEWSRLLAVGCMATMLLGLDVTDSVRREVVNGGYAVALTSAALCVALIIFPRRETNRV